MISRGEHVLIGLSGGADSVCLLIMLHDLSQELGIQINAAYIDHGFRPSEVPGEIEFCGKLCSERNICFLVRSIDPLSYSESEKISKQEAARVLRYKAFEDITLETGASKIALAHNADDLAETMIMHLIRGSGPLGLSGIPPVRGRIIRPLIETERMEIEEFLSQRGAEYITDSSNLKNDYMRNRVRHFIMPAIKNINREFIGTTLRTAAIFRDEERYFNILVTKTLMKLISRKSNAFIELFLAPMEHMDTVLLRRVLRRSIAETRDLRGLGLEHVEALMRLIRSGKSGDRIYLPHSIRAVKSYATLILTSEPPSHLPEYTISPPGEVVLKESALVLKLSILDADSGNDDFGDGKNTACLDAGKLNLPLKVRSRRTGDFFYPLGFGKRKKIQDYFVDEKIPRDERDSVPLLMSGSDIACIIGRRVDERFKVDDNTTKIMQLEIRPMKF